MTVKLEYPGGAKLGTNTWHIRDNGTPFPGPTPGPAVLVKDFYTRNASQYGSTYKWTWDGTLAEVGAEDPVLVGGHTPWTVQGSSGGGADSGPAGVGLCVTWRSSRASRRGRGRTFLAPLPAGFFAADGTVDETRLGTIRTSAMALAAASTLDANGAVGVWSELDRVFRDITSASVNDQVAYMSSRRR